MVEPTFFIIGAPKAGTALLCALPAKMDETLRAPVIRAQGGEVSGP